jgi:hypothetical protein
MTKDEALKMCLEYIETDAHERKYVRHAIKEALAQSMAYLPPTPSPENACYTPPSTWVGLTPEDTFEIGERLGLSDIAWVDLMQAIEAKLKEKNT